MPYRVRASAAATLFSVAVAAVAFLLSGCSGEAPRGDAPSPGGRASAPPERKATAHRGPQRTTAEGSGGAGFYAPRNDGPIPDVVGMEAKTACRALLRGGYAGGVFGEVEAPSVPAGRVVRQDPKPGYVGGEGQLVHLFVSTPFPDALPRSYPCVERREGA